MCPGPVTILIFVMNYVSRSGDNNCLYDDPIESKSGDKNKNYVY